MNISEMAITCISNVKRKIKDLQNFLIKSDTGNLSEFRALTVNYKKFQRKTDQSSLTNNHDLTVTKHIF